MAVNKVLSYRPMGCIPSDYEPRDYSVAFVSDKYGSLEWPESDLIPEEYGNYDQGSYGTCVLQSLRYGPHRHYDIPFGINLLYGLARPETSNSPGTSMRTVNDFFVKYGIPPLTADPKEYEMPTARRKAEANMEAGLAAAAPYKGWTYARAYIIDEIKAAIRDRRHITFRMEVSRNGLDKANFFRGDGKNGIGHHAMVIVGYGPRVNAKGKTVEAVIVRNSWGEDWGDAGECYMTWEDVLAKNEIYIWFPPAAADPTPTPIITPRRTLRKGHTGDDVAEAQTKLTAHGFPKPPAKTLKIDGDFGSKTFAATVEFQTAKALDADGIIGPLTWAELDKTPVPIDPVPEPTTDREKFFARVFQAAAALIGSNYSQADRYKVYAGGYFDCSVFAWAIFAAAGLPLTQITTAMPDMSELTAAATEDTELSMDADAYITAAGIKELLTSMYQVYADQFDLIYPVSEAQIGKNLPSPDGLLSTYGAQQGDVAFACFDSDTTRYNKITHVMMLDKGASNIVHIANNTAKCTRVPLTYGNKKICAIIRLKQGFKLPTLPELQRGDSGYMVRMLQVCLNIWAGQRLVCDGQFGPKTAAAVASTNRDIGLTSEICTVKTWAALGLPIA